MPNVSTQVKASGVGSATIGRVALGAVDFLWISDPGDGFTKLFAKDTMTLVDSAVAITANTERIGVDNHALYSAQSDVTPSLEKEHAFALAPETTEDLADMDIPAACACMAVGRGRVLLGLQTGGSKTVYQRHKNHPHAKLAAPELEEFDCDTGTITGLAIGDGHFFVADDGGKVQKVSLSDSTSPVVPLAEWSNVPSGFSIVDIAANNGYVYVLCGKSVTDAVLIMLDSDDLYEYDSLTLTGYQSPQGLTADESYVYIVDAAPYLLRVAADLSGSVTATATGLTSPKSITSLVSFYDSLSGFDGEGAITGTLGITGTVGGVARAKGSITGTLGITGTVAGSAYGKGSITGTVGITGAVQGRDFPVGSTVISGPLITIVLSGSAMPSGQITGPVLDVLISGALLPHGSISRTLGITGTVAGAAHGGSISGTLGITGTVAGAVTTGTASYVTAVIYDDALGVTGEMH